jgi:hypothetical protein
MKIAYLILAHNNFIHLQRLIDALNEGDCRFYIHIDKKFPLPGIQGNNIIFLEDRVKVYWSTFSEVTATLKLMRRAMHDDNDYFVLLSGSDYPVRSNGEIIKRLSAGKEFVEIHLAANEPLRTTRFIYYYFNNVDRRTKNFKTFVTRAIERTMRALHIRKRVPFQLFWGSQWFALSKGCVQYVLQQAESKKYKTFRSSRFACESFFQTIIGNAPFLNNSAPTLTFAHWEKGAVSPSPMRIEYLGEIKTGSYLFARKFNDQSSGIIELIDQQLRNAGMEQATNISN